MRPPGQRTRQLGALALRALLPLLVASALWSLATAPQGALGRGRRGLLEADAGTALVPGSGSSSAFALARAAAAVQLEQRIDADPLLGACYQQTPLLPGLPEWACQDLHCLWSEAGQQNVDLFLSPLQAMSSGTVPGMCPEPRGGQRPLPAGGAPVVSFVVTMHNNAEVTAQCLLELFRTAHEVESAEFILVNDGSTQDVGPAVQAARLLRQHFGARVLYLSNRRPRGYGAANTQAITAASGEFVVLANNDMFVVRGWLSSIMRTFAERADAGLVGPLFVGDGGLVTEAGGVVFEDASAANYGRGGPPIHELSHLREVDYVSAACVVFRRALFAQLGGFDPRYEMGYYEDTDFAMAVRAAGLRVLLQPLAVVHHQEGGTFGTDTTSDLKRRLMEQNRERFQNKWESTLQTSHCTAAAGQAMQANGYSWPKVLWVDDIVPEPDHDSGSIRTLNMLRILLGAGFHVTFLPTAAQRFPRYPARLRALGVDVLPPRDSSAGGWNLTGRVGDGCPFDVALVARRDMYLSLLGALERQCPGLPRVYDTVDLHYLREARDAITAGAGAGVSTAAAGGASTSQATATWPVDAATPAAVLEWLESDAPGAPAVRRNRDTELALVRHSDLTLVVSPDEVQVIQHYLPDAKVAVVSNIHEVSRTPPKATCKGRTGMLFVGNMNHPPNRQAVEVLIREVVPLVRAMLPRAALQGAVLHVVGANEPPEALMQLFAQHQGNVTFHGQISDDELRTLYDSVRVVVAPLLSGAGVKGKVNQAMKSGVPVVATPLAVEGMHATDGRDCLLATGPRQFAAAVVSAYTDCPLWEKLVAGGHANMAAHFGMEAATPALQQAFSSVGAGPMPRPLRGNCKAVALAMAARGGGAASSS